MKATVAICYFHRKIGPMVFYSYPENTLIKEEESRLSDIMDQTYEEGFFTHKFGDLTSMNYYFEIESEFARGNKEMLMISFVTDSNPTAIVEKIIVDFCNAFANKLKENKKAYKAFYNLTDSKVTKNDIKSIKKHKKNLKNWVNELYWLGIEELRERTEEEKWAYVMAKPEIFRVIKKLSKGPLALEDLEHWFKTVFPKHNLQKILNELEDENFVFINSIGQDSYVLLVKEVVIMRVPPNCLIDLEEDSPNLADLTIIYINEVRDFFETYKPNPLDSLELFKLFANPKIYSVITQLREKPLPKETILSMVSKTSSESLLKNLDLLEESSIIQSFSYSGESLYLLKTDVILTASFPEYLKKLLPKESKGYIARPYSPIEKNNYSIKNESTQKIMDIDNKREVERYNAINQKFLKFDENFNKDMFITKEKQIGFDKGKNKNDIKNQISNLQLDLLRKLDFDEEREEEKKVNVN